jgi:hypothetical protein
MQTISWSPNLLHAVKKLKNVEPFSNFNESKVLASLQLSSTEGQAIKWALTPNTKPEILKAWW